MFIFSIVEANLLLTKGIKNNNKQRGYGMATLNGGERVWLHSSSTFYFFYK
jgi:hypothetical protein